MKKLILISLFFVGCASSEVVRRQYEPTKMIVVKYQNSIIDYVARDSRESAMEKGRFFCKDKVKLISESVNYRIVQSEDFKEPFIDPEASPLNSGGDIYLVFRCD